MARRILPISFSIVAIVLAALAVAAAAAPLPGTPFSYRFLWPANPAQPGKDYVELTVRPGAAVKENTPLGPAEGRALALFTPGGELAAEARLLTLPDQPRVWIFIATTKQEITAPTGDYNTPHFALPAIAVAPGYRHVLNFREEEFVTPIRYAVPTAGPVVMYTDGLQTLTMSPLDHFMSAMQVPVKGEWRCGFGGLIEKVPAGTVTMTLLVGGEGVNAGFMRWGRLIQAWHNHQPADPYADVALSRLGYWTDNGAYYYYRTEPGMNYEETLLAVKAYADEARIPYGYFQLDSWWYPKAAIADRSSKNRGGALLWEPIPEMFPTGLAAFTAKLGLPLVAHNRFVADQSPYCKKYQCVFSNNDKKQGAYPTDPAFWDEIMDNAKKYGIEVYEQDWLYTHMAMIPWMRSGLGHAESWYDNMAEAAARRGLTMQLCMASPEFFLQQLKHGNATHARVSHDYKGGLPKAFFWMPFHKASLFARAVGLWPFKDNFQSTSGQSPRYNIVPEGNPWEEALISALSGGPVGPSDRIGRTDRALVLRTCREDGLLLKPDRPATPIDVMFLYAKNIFLGGRKPWIVSTESVHPMGTTTYLAAFNLWPQSMWQPWTKLSELGLSGKHLVYNYRTGEIGFTENKINFGLMSPQGDGKYFILAPVLPNGMALVGEVGKFATMSGKRFNNAELDGSAISLALEGVPGEKVTVAVYAPREPKVTAEPAAETRRCPESGLYLISVAMPENGAAGMRIE
jgi:hypothetical protein